MATENVSDPAPDDTGTPSLMDATPAPQPESDNAPTPEGETPEQKAERETNEAKAAADAEEARRAALTDEERAAEDKAKADAEKEAEGAPEAYDDFNLPEGVELDAAIADEFKAAAKELNLSQAKAQQLVDLGTKMSQSWTDRAIEAFDARATGWREAAMADAEFGGQKLNETLPVAVKAREQFGTPELKTLLDEFRLGDHPEVIRFFYRVGKATSEDSFVQQGKPGGDKSAADLLYDHPTSKSA